MTLASGFGLERVVPARKRLDRRRAGRRFRCSPGWRWRRWRRCSSRSSTTTSRTRAPRWPCRPSWSWRWPWPDSSSAAWPAPWCRGSIRFGLSDRGRTAYVYAAEAIALVICVHLRLTVPDLFRLAIVAKYWMLMVMAVAFGGAGLSELFHRRGLAVLSEPLERTAMLLPLAPAIGFWFVPTLQSARAVALGRTEPRGVVPGGDLLRFPGGHPARSLADRRVHPAEPRGRERRAFGDVVPSTTWNSSGPIRRSG